MGRRFAAALMLVGTLIGLLVGTAGSVAADTNYTCPDQSCSFSVPDSYTEASNDASQIIFQDANSGGSFSVVTQDASGYSSLDDAVNSLISQVSGSNGYLAGSDGVQGLILAGNPADTFSYLSSTSSGTQVEQAVFVSIYQGKLYVLIFSTTPDAEDAFVAGARGVFDSWQFT